MEHTPTILHRLKRYPTYQFHAVISSDQLSQSEAFCRLILETFSWLRARLNGEMPEELNTPEPEKYADFSEDALHSFSLDQGWKANVTYVPERGIWAFSLHETDMGANHGTANERPPVQGRMFETDISFVIRRKLCYNNDNLKVPFRNYAAKINRNLRRRKDMKKGIIIGIIVVVLLVLFLPIPKGTCQDGGTRDYCALTYRIVVWNKLMVKENDDSSAREAYTYHNTSVFWIPDNFKSIDELWKIERGRN